MRWVTQEPGYAPGGDGRNKDDRVIGAALAVQHWNDKLRGQLMRMNITRGRTEDTPERRITVVEAIIARQRALLGIGGNPGVPSARMPVRGVRR
jgi:hypothetical protein